ncbi:MAG: hypothetical protein AB7G68_16305 [Nitrospiraceae bacterium]
MIRFRHLLVTVGVFMWLGACSSMQTVPDRDVISATLPAPAEEVTPALVDVLASEGYDVDAEDTETLTTGWREEIRGPWDWLLRWRFGVGKTRVKAKVISEASDRTHISVQVFHFSKDGILDHWEEADSPLRQSAANQVRLLKNRLHIL